MNARTIAAMTFVREPASDGHASSCFQIQKPQTHTVESNRPMDPTRKGTWSIVQVLGAPPSPLAIRVEDAILKIDTMTEEVSLMERSRASPVEVGVLGEKMFGVQSWCDVFGLIVMGNTGTVRDRLMGLT